jgi:prepilin-type N-terminal cleavage/methylation domain-containing protein/prepilin-type processing-associated H-X9-DG protein
MISQMRAFRGLRCAGSSRAGFTLLEVLVVVAIIAMLVAILVPSVARARQQTRKVQCQSNLKQIATAWELYFHDSKDRLMRGTNKEYNYGGRQGNGSNAYGKNPNQPVLKPLNNYFKLGQITRVGGEVFSCPSDTGTRFVRPSAFTYYGTSYYPNNLLIGQNQVTIPPGDPCEAACGLWTGVNRKIAKLTRAGIQDGSRVILIGDYSWLDNWDPSVSTDFPYWHQTRAMHNLAFVDGHVEFVRIRKGIHVDKRYTVIPFTGELRMAAEGCQAEIPFN